MVYDFPLDEDRVWDWAVRLAEDTALLSKDPSTQVGAVIFDDKKRILSAAYNGFPRKIADDHRLNDRDLKLKITLHAVRGPDHPERNRPCLLALAGRRLC